MTGRVALVVPASSSGELGGAERFFLGLRQALEDAGAAAELISVPSDEGGFEQIKEGYLRFYDLDLSGFDGVVTSKSPAYVVRHPNHVCYLQHTMRVFYDMFETEFPAAGRQLHEQRRLVHSLDTAALRPPRLRALFAIGAEVAARLKQWNGLDATVMHHPSTLEAQPSGEFHHVLLPGRLHRWKRVDLAIEAFRRVRAPIELLIPGTGEDGPRFQALAAGDRRIRFLGRVSDAALAQLYADALAVLFLPMREDLGLVTLEAWGAGKPVITCADAGEPARLVADQVSGFVCPPDPGAIAERIEALAADPARARAMGANGRRQAEAVTWADVGGRLVAALGLRRP